MRHTVVDGQPEHWKVEKLLAVKDTHERRMTALTANDRSDGLTFHLPRAVMLEPVIGGRQLLNTVGPAYAYAFDADDLQGETEHAAAKSLPGEAHDCAEIYTMLSPAEHIDLAQGLSERLSEALSAGLILKGKQIDVDVTDPAGRHRWPVAISASGR